MRRPMSLSEWETYIQHLTREALYDQTVAANTHTFARVLLEEGIPMGDVEQILLLFVRQLRAFGIKLPEGGPFDLVTMAMMDAQAKKGMTHSPEEVALHDSLVETTQVEDDLDLFDQVAEGSAS